MTRWTALGLAAIACFGAACNRGASKHEHQGEHGHGDQHKGEHKGEHEDAHQGEHGHGDEHEQLPRRVKLEPAVIADAKIQSAPARRQALSATLALPGEITANPDRVARIASPAAGRIERVRMKEGDRVKRGDELVVVRVPEIGRVRSGHAATRARAVAARANADRLRELFEKQLAAEQAVKDAEAEAEALEIEARSLGAELGALGAGASGALSVTLRAPIDGTLVAREAVLGQPVSPDQTLGTIAALDQVWFLARVFEKDLGRLRVDAEAEVHLNAYPAEHFAGKVEYVGQQVDPTARTVTARITLANRGDLLRLGLFGTAQVSLGEGAAGGPKLVVPQSAVAEIGGKKLVFVELPGGEFEMHDVTLGEEALGKVEVLAGLRDGEAVVVDGVFTLKSIVLKGSFAEDHH